MKRLLVSWAILAVTVALTAALVPGIDITGGVGSWFLIALVFSVVDLVLGGIVKLLTLPLIREYYVSSAPELSYPKTYTLAESIDLNQDGTLEVVVDVSRWEGGGAVVFRVDGQNVREVLRAIC